MAHGVVHGDSTAAAQSQKRKALQPSSFDDRLQVLHQSLESEFDSIPVGQTGAACVVAYETAAPHEQREPRSLDRVLPVEVEVTEPRLRVNKRWSGAISRVRNAHAVATDAKPNL